MAFADPRQALAATLTELYGDIADLALPSGTGNGIANKNAAGHSGPAPTAASSSESLAAFAETIRFCPTCVLHLSRRQLVFGRGPVNAPIVFVGDYPSDADDQSGQPFSDPAGALLQKMIVAMKLRPEEVYLTTLFKGLPTRERAAELDFVRHCEEHLLGQFEFLTAPIVVAMGEHTARALVRSDSPLRGLRTGQEFTWNRRRVFCTHHPRELLAEPGKKKEAWDDLQAVMRAMGKA